MIYLIKNDGYYKIGYSTNVKERMKSYRTASPNCQLIGYKLGTKEDEANWHKKLNDYRIDKREWFKIDNEEIVNSLIEAFTNIDEITHCKLTPNDFNIPEEIWSEYTIIVNGKMLKYILTGYRFCLVDVSNKKLYDIEADIKLFKLDRSWECYNGIVINNELLLYHYINKELDYLNPYNLANFSTIDSPIYSICKERNTIEDYVFKIPNDNSDNLL